MDLGISEEVVEFVIDAVLLKKELQSIHRDFAVKELREFLKRDPKALKFLKQELGPGQVSSKSSEFKRVVKSIRSNLRRYHGLFLEKTRNYDSILERLGNVSDFESLQELARSLLLDHTSSKERVKDYSFIWKQIWDICRLDHFDKVSFLDLGCGFNPFSLVDLSVVDLMNVSFHSYDINQSEQNVLNLFYSQLTTVLDGFSGKSELLDLLDFDAIEKLSTSNVALLFKVTDHLDKGKGHKNTELVVSLVPSRFVVLSFPTVTRTGKAMNFPKRRWVEIMSERLGYAWQKFETSNELFYVIDKEN